MLGLAVPREGTVEAREKIRMAPPQLVVRAGEAHEPAHPTLARRIDAIEPDQLRRQIQPRRVRVERELEIRDRAPHAVLERLARVAHVVEHGAIPFLGDRPPQQASEQPRERPVLLRRVPLHRHAVQHREPHPRAELLAHLAHDLGTRVESKLIRSQKDRWQRIPPNLAGDDVQLVDATLRERHQPVL